MSIMARNYKKVISPKHKPNIYLPAQLEDAIKAVNSGMSINTAAKVYKVPRTTIQDKVNGKHGKEMGRPTVLTNIEEPQAELTPGRTNPKFPLQM